MSESQIQVRLPDGKVLELPAEEQFNFARNACAQMPSLNLISVNNFWPLPPPPKTVFIWFPKSSINFPAALPAQRIFTPCTISQLLK